MRGGRYHQYGLLAEAGSALLDSLVGHRPLGFVSNAMRSSSPRSVTSCADRHGGQPGIDRVS
jgi:hypothetical protein